MLFLFLGILVSSLWALRPEEHDVSLHVHTQGHIVVERIRKISNSTQVTSLQTEGLQAIMANSAQQASGVKFSSALHTDSTRSRWRIGVFTYMSIVVIFALVSWSMRGNPTRALQFIVLCKHSLWMAGATAIIPASYGLMKQFGHGATISGWLIGCIWLPGSVAGIHMNSIYGTVQSESVRKIWLANYVGAAALSLACTVIASPEMVRFGAGNTELKLLCLMACRCVVGFLDGYGSVCESLTLWKVTPKADLVTWETLQSCTRAFGVGLGPMLASGCSWVSGAQSYEDEVAWSSCCIALLWTPLVFLAWLWIPGQLQDMLDFKSKADQQQESALEMLSGTSAQHEVEDLPVLARRQVWTSAAYFGVERAFAVSSIEAATALLLESEFSWKSRSTGLATGLAFICGVPAFVLVRVIKHKFLVSDSHAMMGTATAAMLAATLFIPTVSNLIASGLHDSSEEWILILVADCIMFPSFYMANGYMDGLAIRCCDPTTPYTMENFKLIEIIGQNTVGRAFGPPVARTIINVYGRGAYAILQLCISTSGCFACGLVTLRLSKDHWSFAGEGGNGTEQRNASFLEEQERHSKCK